MRDPRPGHSSRPPGGRIAVTALAVLLASAPVPPGARATPAPDRIAADSLAALADYAAGRPDSALARFAAGMAEARARGDVHALARLTRLDACMRAGVGDPALRLPRIAEALRQAEALADTAGMVRILRARSYVLGARGDLAGTERNATRMRLLARAIADTTFEMLARSTQAWVLMQRGDLHRARAEATAAAAAFRARGHGFHESQTLITLGSTQLRLGDYASARRSMRRSLTLARESGNAFAEAQALNDLGALEGHVGDPSLSESMYVQASASHASRGEWREAVLSRTNLAHSLTRLGRHHDAREVLLHVIEVCDRQGFRAQRAITIAGLGRLESGRGRDAAAIRRWRQALALGDTLPPDARCDTVEELALALERQGRGDEALAWVAGALPSLRGRASMLDLQMLEIHQMRLRGPLGAPRAAARRLTQLGLEAETAHHSRAATAAHLAAARLLRRAGAPLEAQGALEQATRNWERTRAVTANLEWRELSAHEGSAIAAEWIELGLTGATGGDSVSAAFDAVQRFKARTLIERLAGPDASLGPDSARLALPDLTLERFRRETLRAGELFLDVLVGEERSTLLAITRDGARLIRWPGRAELARRVTLVRDLVARATAVPADIATAAWSADLERLFARVLPLVDSSRVVILSPDDALQILPVALGRPVAFVPSAGFLARMRVAPAPAGGPPTALALLAAQPAGRPSLPGARREVRNLARRHAGVTTVIAQEAPAAATWDALGSHDALHVAGHVVLDDQRPWRSHVPLATGAGDSSQLRAEDIARRRLPARLVVLSGCESAGGRVRAGEGVSGLASAFLVAGARAVIASQWPVDDASTARLMGHFYDALAADQPVAGALASAREALRRDPATAHPFHWSGWVVVGDPETRLPLARNRGPGRMLLGAMGLAAAAAIAVAIRGLHQARARRL